MSQGQRAQPNLTKTKAPSAKLTGYGFCVDDQCCGGQRENRSPRPRKSVAIPSRTLPVPYITPSVVPQLVMNIAMDKKRISFFINTSGTSFAID
jgi:hypothetical protein